MGGFQRTLQTINAYKSERATGTQLFKKINIMTAIWLDSLAARTGATTRKLIRNSMNSRKVKEKAVTNAPASDPRAKARRVAPKAISMNLMANDSGSGSLPAGAR